MHIKHSFARKFFFNHTFKRLINTVILILCVCFTRFAGYGNVFPHTGWGKFATIVYAIFGMPLFLLYLSNIGDLLAKSFKWLYAKFCLCKICRLRKGRTLSNSMPRRSMSTSSWRNATNDKAWQVSTNRY